MAKNLLNIDLSILKKRIVEALSKKYGMTVSQFSNSKHPKKLKIPGGNTFRCSLHGPGVSMPILAALCEDLGIGTLEREVEVKKVVTYSLKGATVNLDKAPEKPAKPAPVKQPIGRTKKVVSSQPAPRAKKVVNIPSAAPASTPRVAKKMQGSSAKAAPAVPIKKLKKLK